MGFDEGRLFFDHDNLVYNPGQVVQGKLVFITDKVKQFRGLYVIIKGYCNVHWTTQHSRKVGDREEHYTEDHTSNEEYFRQKTYLMGGESGEVFLEPGNHEFPFQCLIPGHCPSSFEGSNGYIRYEVKVVVDRPFKFDQEKEVRLTVVNPRDLNVDPYCKQPIQIEFEQSYCCWCMSAGVCVVTAALPQSGYCPSQIARVDLNCENKSNVEISIIQFEIIEYRKFIATHNPDERFEENVIAKLKKGPIPGNTTRNWVVEIDIPDIPVYNVDACKYIDIHHDFRITVSPSGCHSDSYDSRRLILGNIPLREPGGPEPTLPIVNQPGVPNNSGYPGSNPYPSLGLTPLPGLFVNGSTDRGPNPPYPGSNPPYPDPNTTYPGPYPSPNPPYPVPNQPYPAPSPYPVANPGQNLPIVSPVPGPQYPGENPYNPGNVPFPASPYPSQPGFTMPLVNDSKQNAASPFPTPANVPYPPNSATSPFAGASAPEPSTPDFGFDKNPPPFNPETSKGN